MAGHPQLIINGAGPPK